MYLPGRSVAVLNWNRRPLDVTKWMKKKINCVEIHGNPYSFVQTSAVYADRIYPFLHLNFTLINHRESKLTLLWRRRPTRISKIKELRNTTKIWFGKYDTTQQRLNLRRREIKLGWLSMSIYESLLHPEWYYKKDTVVVVFLEEPLQEGKR